ncbi:MAG: NADH dehydrogenase [Candidatus Omnitrophica bacterium]|nr:NADH dehydrogenase [Candidatus Omnitrophota bacterium]
MSTMMQMPVSWLGIIFLPLILAGLFVFKRIRPFLIKLVPLGALPALLASLFMHPGAGIKIPWLFFESMFVLDATGKMFLFFTSVLWLLAGMYSVCYVSDSSRRIRYFVCFLLAMSGNLGLILAQDVFSFYFLFALMSFSSFGLVVHEKSADAAYAGKIYLILVVIGEAFVFLGLLLLAHSTDTIYIHEAVKLLSSQPQCGTVMGLMFFGFGIKAGALPLHVWLPLAHPVAPTPASAVLSGAMIKAGLLGWVRFLPLGASGFQDWGYTIILLGIAAAIYGALVGLTQNKIKSVLAYSSISQMGMMTILVGVGLLNPAIWKKSWMVLMFYAVHHGLAKGALFLSVGTAVSQMKSNGLRLLRDMAVIWPAVAVVGLPFTSGEMAKGGLKMVLKKSSAVLPHVELILILVSVSAVTTALIMARFLWLTWRVKQETGETSRDVPGLMLPWMILVLLVFLFPFWITFLNVVPSDGMGLIIKADLKNMWPFGLAMGIFIAARLLRLTNPLRIPQGDVLWGYAKCVNGLRVWIIGIIKPLQKGRENLEGGLGILSENLLRPSKYIDSMVEFFSSWKVFGILIFSLCIILMMSLGW